MSDGTDRSAGVPRAVALGAGVLALLSPFAFGPRYLARLPAGIDVYTHAHALLGAAWLALLIAQPVLILRRKRAAHRALGGLAWVLGPAFVVSGVLLAHYRFAGMEAERFVSEGWTLYLPFSATLLFALAWSLGLACRRSVALHGRFMACTALPLVDPVLSRILGIYLPPLPREWMYQAITFGLAGVLVTWMLLSLPARSMERRAFGALALAFACVFGFRFLAAESAVWRAAVYWFRALPLG